jgi:arsenate reductase
MMSPIVVYEKPTCSTCQAVVSLLTDRGADFRRVDYFADRLSPQQLQTLLRKAGLRPHDVVRMKEPGAAQLRLDDDEAILRALADQPKLLQRPLVELDDRVLLARPPERVLELLT